ncbi:putative wall-associated receptor kinase-like protein 16 [Cinnamomum micranthum f. kanehirae]|uniref:Putative wall-associated receptor kinase-like protein 16 n=1 Tax=Cinnamomum micranthum f. kanehirae TaxID=337451 RepID=A0A443N7R5_9MAGN|nr:putative wall-associated receptor kinase-like protein 16 [Cinnamomum micranthum f. kanehirae]
MKDDRLFEMLEERIRSEGSEEQFMAIARLAMRCLNFKGEERPIMKDVVVDLQGFRGFQDHPCFKDNEIERMLCETSQDCIGDARGQDSVSIISIICIIIIIFFHETQVPK